MFQRVDDELGHEYTAASESISSTGPAPGSRPHGAGYAGRIAPNVPLSVKVFFRRVFKQVEIGQWLPSWKAAKSTL